MKDFLGNELAVDDYVIYTYSGYKGYIFGRILKFSPKMVTLVRIRNIEQVKPSVNDENDYFKKREYPSELIKCTLDDVERYFDEVQRRIDAQIN